MIAKLQNPAFAAVAGIIASVAVGVTLSMRVLGPLMQKAATPVVKEVPEEVKQKGWDFWTIEIENLSNELKDERAKVKKQAEQLDLRASQIASETKELAKVRAEIESLRRDLNDKVVEIKADEAKNLRTLAQTYTTLTPRAVVAIVRELDDNTAVKILSLMKTDIVGPIFEEMSKTATAEGTPLARRAAILSEKLRVMKATKQPATSS
jgi:flagellar motility protein MotE (MotC chaperone)